MTKPTDVTAYLATLDEAQRSGIDALRAIVRAAAPELEETIKWNAPSYMLAGTDVVTLGIERKGGWRIVLHRGAKPKTDAFAFTDADKVATWPAKDRGVIVVKSLAEARTRAPAMQALITRWVAAVG